MKLSEAKKLKVGDRVHWDDPDDGLCSKTFTIGFIRITGEVIALSDPEYTFELECLAHELSPASLA